MNAGSGRRRVRTNLTGTSMGQLRTANNRRNRAVRNTIGRRRAAAETATVETAAAPTAKAKTAQKDA